MSWQLSILEVGVIPGVPLQVYLPDAPDGVLVDPPCFCFIAADGSHTVLVDTGPDQVRSGQAGLRIEGDSASLLVAGLRAAGLTPDDVDLIVHTHLHYDHMQNDLLFPGAQVAVQRTELAWAKSADSGPFYVGVGELASALGERLRLLDGETEILPGLTALPNGGHTPGHQSVLARTAAGDACVCGDIVSLQENLTVIGPVCPDREATQAFLERARTTGWQMLPSHDARLREHRWYQSAAASPAGPGPGGRACR
jgi:glyoxylase-like metal-dependent hydrolase (beta-lactamase superfamily II)